ncbi:Hypothetical protein ORPV_1083 [Orpheovirus IHUMI-LCC2]|uniref:Cyclic nucleotide-binding domain-containing protein n=1 Tax=Orpheovirus IHUMI-LCC2 TaxID=2023057 RepID=A0A2I2L634_9VIRU|nr:Hypothetical protein ORPV_1083 [Orpheovirus IHUMI-LCC2]SNW62987.1 Hypothetical protein ORPV_1083 [Orpheovirus IHUMI-LCC2]
MEQVNDYLYPDEYVNNKEVWLQYIKNCNPKDGKYVISDGVLHYFQSDDDRSQFIGNLPEVGRLAYIIDIPMDCSIVL